MMCMDLGTPLWGVHECRDDRTTYMDVLVPRKAWMLRAAIKDDPMDGGGRVTPGAVTERLCESISSGSLKNSDYIFW